MLFTTVEDALSLIDLEQIKEMIKKNAGYDDDEGDVGDDAVWCNIKGCSKKFNHQHIGAGGVGSLVRSEATGSEALCDNVFDRI